jgi:hypothetical protein
MVNVNKTKLTEEENYLNASALSPGFTVTDSICVGRQGWYLETRAGTGFS